MDKSIISLLSGDFWSNKNRCYWNGLCIALSGDGFYGTGYRITFLV